jgi:hypothetical protein
MVSSAVEACALSAVSYTNTPPVGPVICKQAGPSLPSASASARHRRRVPARWHLLDLGDHEVEVLAEAFRRAVLREFARLALLTEDDARSMLQWPHSGFHINHSVWLEADDACGLLQLARNAAGLP